MTLRVAVGLLLIASGWISSAYAQPPRLLEVEKQAMAATPDAGHGRILYLKHCTGCHGAQGWGEALKGVPALAGQREFYIVAQLAQFALLERNGSAMHASMKPGDVNLPQSLRDLAAYLSAADRNPRPGYGDGHARAPGGELYQRNCAMCHGESGEGSGSEPIPAIGGQHYEYLVSQLESFAAGHRGQVEPPVIDFTAGLSASQREGVADYVSRLPALTSTRSPRAAPGTSR